MEDDRCDADAGRHSGYACGYIGKKRQFAMRCVRIAYAMYVRSLSMKVIVLAIC